MSVSIAIVPISKTVDMYGVADPFSAYSLAGHVTVSISSPFSLFEPRRPTRILLHSVNVTFEGQSETITPKTGYSSIRLCSVTRDIIPSEPMEMDNGGHEDSGTPCLWNVVFDLPIPGWLPPSSSYGKNNFGVKYALFAEAKFSYVVDSFTASWSVSTLYSAYRSRIRTLTAHKRIELKRFIYPLEETLADGSPIQETLTYVVTPEVARQNTGDSVQFPAEILSKMQILASVPEHVDIGRSKFPLIICMKTKDLEIDQRRRLRVSSVSVDIVQKERYRRRPSAEYSMHYPLPPLSQQPPCLRLRDPHAVSSLYEVGLGPWPATCDSITRRFSLLPPGETGVRSFSENNYPCAGDADSSSESTTWYNLDSYVPFVQHCPDDVEQEWAGSPSLRPSVTSPLINVTHDAAVEVVYTYNIPGTDEIADERLMFLIPIQFAQFAPDFRHRSMTPPPTHSHELVAQSTNYCPSLLSPILHALNLPAYSQLFDHNGDQKIDYSVILPLYTPRSPNGSFIDYGSLP